MNKDLVLGLVRHALTLVGGLAVQYGYLTESMSVEAVGAVTSILSISWFVIGKLTSKESK